MRSLLAQGNHVAPQAPHPSPLPGVPGRGRINLPYQALLKSFVLSIFIASCSPLLSAEPSKPPLPFELQPYRVRISIAFADAPSLDSELRKSVIRELPIAADRVLGEMWTVDAEDNSWLLPATADKLGTLTADTLPADWQSEARDKAFLITVEESGGEYAVSGREWDQMGRLLGKVEARRIVQRQELSESIFALTRSLFRAVVAIEKVANGTASITPKAGALTPADPSSVQLKKGQFWQPYMRYRSSKGEVDRLQSVPWTLLQVEEVNADNTAHGQAKIISGLRAALPSRKRARIEVLARALEPVGTTTDLRLVSRQNNDRPLVGVVVDARTKVDGPTQRYLTDRNGTVKVAPLPDSPLLWLYVRSGQKVLARLPVVPGLLANVQAELPDDSIRLRVEGELEILEANLTDTVAQRAVMMARIRKQVQFNDWKSVPQLLKELHLLPGIDFYMKELTAIRVPAIQAAKAARDKSAEAYIERVCSEASKIVQKYLDDDKLRTFEEELKEIKKANALPPKPTEKPKATAKAKPVEQTEPAEEPETPQKRIEKMIKAKPPANPF